MQSYAYDVYGTPYIKTGSGYTEMKNFAGNLHGNDRLFTGREYDRDINLYYYRARFYSPELGRFISRDPIGMSDDVNLYAYVGNSPMMGVDPDGRMAKKAFFAPMDFTTSIAGSAFDYASDAIDGYEVGRGLQVAGTTVATATAGACATTTTVTASCAGMAFDGPLPAIVLCIPTGVAAGASCGVTGAAVLTTGLGTWMASSGNGGGGGGVKGNKGANWDVGERVKTPSTHPDEFSTGKVDGLQNGGNGFIDKKTGDIWSKSNTSHTGDSWKKWSKGTKDFGANSKVNGTRRSVSDDGRITSY